MDGRRLYIRGEERLYVLGGKYITHTKYKPYPYGGVFGTKSVNLYYDIIVMDGSKCIVLGKTKKKRAFVLWGHEIEVLKEAIRNMAAKEGLKVVQSYRNPDYGYETISGIEPMAVVVQNRRVR